MAPELRKRLTKEEILRIIEENDKLKGIDNSSQDDIDPLPRKKKTGRKRKYKMKKGVPKEKEPPGPKLPKIPGEK